MAKLRFLRVAMALGVTLLVASPLFAEDWRIREPVIDGKTVNYWAIALKNPDVTVRRMAVDNLRQFLAWSDAALPVLLDALVDPDREIREMLLTVIAPRHGELAKNKEYAETIVKSAERLLRQPDASARTMGVNLLYYVPESRLVDELIDVLDDPDAQVRFAAAGALRQYGIDTRKRFRRIFAAWERLDRTARPAIPETPVDPESPDAVREPANNDPMVAAIKDALEHVIRRSRFGSAAAIEATRHPKGHVRLNAIALCQSMQLEADVLREIFRRAVKDSDVRVRCFALAHVNQYERNGAAAWSILSKALDDPDARIRESAAAAFRNCRENDPKNIPELMSRTHHPDALVRAAAIDRLSHFATDADRIARPLLRLFDDPDPDIRFEMARFAGQALATGSRSARAAVLDRLVRAMMEDDEVVSAAACDALVAAECIDREARTVILLRVLRDSKFGFARAIQQLPEFEPSGARAIPLLLGRSDERKDIYGLYTALMLLRFGDAGEKAFLRILEQVDPDQIADLAAWMEFFTKSAPVQRAAAYRGLAAAKAPARGKAILALLGEGSHRRSGWNGIGSTPIDLSEIPPAAMQTLVDSLGDSDSDNRKNTCRVLQMTAPTPLVIRTLLRAAQDKDASVRLAAVEGLRRHHVYPEPVVERLFEAAKDPGPAGECALQTLVEIDVDALRLTPLVEERIRSGGWTLDWNTVSFAGLPREPLAKALVQRLENENLASESVTIWRLLEGTKTIAVSANDLVPVLKKLACHWDWHMRLAALERLGAFGPSAKSALGLVGARCADEAEAVADSARAALDKIDR
jgi:hypothetical protein